MLTVWTDGTGTHEDVDRALASFGAAPIAYFSFRNGLREPAPVEHGRVDPGPVEPEPIESGPVEPEAVTPEPVQAEVDELDAAFTNDQLTLAFQLRHLASADVLEVASEESPPRTPAAPTLPVLSLTWPSDRLAPRQVALGASRLFQRLGRPRPERATPGLAARLPGPPPAASPDPQPPITHADDMFRRL